MQKSRNRTEKSAMAMTTAVPAILQMDRLLSLALALAFGSAPSS